MSLPFREEMGRNPVARLNSAIDLLTWLDELGHQDRQLLALRFEGYTLEETATIVGIGISTAFQRLKALGRELAAEGRGCRW